MHEIDFAKPLQPRDHLFANDCIRGSTTALIGAPGSGKTTLLAAEAVAMATGTPLFGADIDGPHRVLLICPDDDLADVERRLAAVFKHHKLPPASIHVMAFGDPVVSLHDYVTQHQIDAVIVDPVKTADEVREFRLLAKDLNIAVCLATSDPALVAGIRSRRTLLEDDEDGPYATSTYAPGDPWSFRIVPVTVDGQFDVVATSGGDE